jgi:hypothetical protein
MADNGIMADTKSFVRALHNTGFNAIYMATQPPYEGLMLNKSVYVDLSNDIVYWSKSSWSLGKEKLSFFETNEDYDMSELREIKRLMGVDMTLDLLEPKELSYNDRIKCAALLLQQLDIGPSELYAYQISEFTVTNKHIVIVNGDKKYTLKVVHNEEPT